MADQQPAKHESSSSVSEVRKGVTLGRTPLKEALQRLQSFSVDKPQSKPPADRPVSSPRQ